MAATIIDSDSNLNSTTNSSDKNTRFGQSFTCLQTSVLAYTNFYLRTFGSPIGNVFTKIYAHSGTFGVDGVPTGSPLATSDPIDISTISASFSLMQFNFSGVNAITLNTSTHYFLVLDISSAITYDGSDLIITGIEIPPSITGTTVQSSNGTLWTAFTSYALSFFVYGNVLNFNRSFFRLM